MKRLWIISLCALLVMIGVGAAGAQNELELTSLRVGLWPEYDQAALLVIYWGELPTDTTFPATITLRIPGRVVRPHVVAAQPAPDAGIDEVDYDTTLDGDWRTITFESGGPLFQLEYYDSLTKTDDLRTVQYIWPGDYAVGAFNVEFQQPPHSENLNFDPALPQAAMNEGDNLVYHGEAFGALTADQSQTITVTYTRDSDDLTLELLNALNPPVDTAPPASAGAVAAASDSGGTDVLLLVIVAVVSFLLGAAAMRVAINLQEINRQRRR
jgi:hypothetical protein